MNKKVKASLIILAGIAMFFFSLYIQKLADYTFAFTMGGGTFKPVEAILSSIVLSLLFSLFLTKRVPEQIIKKKKFVFLTFKSKKEENIFYWSQLKYYFLFFILVFLAIIATLAFINIIRFYQEIIIVFFFLALVIFIFFRLKYVKDHPR